MVVLDAGTGVRLIREPLDDNVRRVDVLLTHLHMDHIIGLGFFEPLRQPGLEVHVWGPSSATLGLHGRLTRYLSPPLFPVRIRDLECHLVLHDVPLGTFSVPGLDVTAELVCHPGPTVGFRLDDGKASVTYLPDHEVALGAREFPSDPEWTSGYDLAHGVDLLIHDTQYSDEEYAQKVGWGHCTLNQALAFAKLTEVDRFLAFHHDPKHDDDMLDARFGALSERNVVAAREGQEFTIGNDA
jgi:ribonuclease BN (tRNA processing enzyme)